MTSLLSNMIVYICLKLSIIDDDDDDDDDVGLRKILINSTEKNWVNLRTLMI